MHLFFLPLGLLIWITGLMGLMGPGRMLLHWRVWQTIGSLGFVLVGIGASKVERPQDRAVVVGLVFCLIGDLALQWWFPSGVIAFLIGHVCFIAAFWLRGLDRGLCIAGTIAATPVAIGAAAWILPHVSAGLMPVIVLYMLVITAMVVAAAGAIQNWGGIISLVGAVLFFISDICVAQGAFMPGKYTMAGIGPPLYYAGTLLLALGPAFVPWDEPIYARRQRA